MMNESQLAQLYQSRNESQILFCFSGPFHQGLIEELGQALRGYVRQSEAKEHRNQTAFRQVFAAFIEQSQNTKRYLDSLDTPSAERSGIVVIGRIADRYFVRSGNQIRKRDTPALQKQLEYIQNLDKHELKLRYKDIMHAPRRGNSAGLGMLNMARKASRPLDFSFSPVDETYDYFSLSVIL